MSVLHRCGEILAHSLQNFSFFNSATMEGFFVLFLFFLFFTMNDLFKVIPKILKLIFFTTE